MCSLCIFSLYSIKYTQDKDEKKIWQIILFNLGAGVTLLQCFLFFSSNVYCSAKQAIMNQLFMEFAHSFLKAFLDNLT